MGLILASGSPRRAELLRVTGVDFAVDVADVDESVLPGEDAVAYVARVARAKCLTVAARHRDAIVLAADTTVVLDGLVLGKPADAAEATDMLTRLSGRTHQVHTAMAVWSGGLALSRLVTTDVTFGDLSTDEIAAYVALGESFDKAGGYGIQSAGAMLVERIDGSPSNVIGLPVRETLAMLRSAGWPVRPSR
ncbi:MAG TPA: Maf family protein [Ilumatobacter sp.]|nr:Maf family protein [Ilumatobacter sp.]